MDICRKLHEDPAVRALLWCLLGSNELNVATLKQCGMTDVEAQAIVKDEPGLLRRMRLRHSVAMRLKVSDLAAMLRNRLSELTESAKKSAELASILRCLPSLPVWLFDEWEKARTAQTLSRQLHRLDGLQRA